MKFLNNEIIWGFLVCFVINELKRFLFVVYMIEKKKYIVILIKSYLNIKIL